MLPFAEKRAQKSHPPHFDFFQKKTAALNLLSKPPHGLVAHFRTQNADCRYAVFFITARQVLIA